MCGIVGYLGNREARQILVDCLSRLDYRGYDAAGVGIIGGGKLKTLRSIGNASLKTALKRTPLPGKIGVAHSFRARQGDPSNVYPLTERGNTLAVVYDGAIDNALQLRGELERKGHVFNSRTDSELVAHLLERSEFGLDSALRLTLPLLRGTFGLIVLSHKEPDKIIAARKGAGPLIIGHHNDGFFVTSDVPAISHYTRAIQILEEGELAVVSYGGVKISKFDGTPVQRALTQAVMRSGDTDETSSQETGPMAYRDAQLARAETPSVLANAG